MAMNRIMTMAEKEIRDYAQRQMERAEQRGNIVVYVSANGECVSHNPGDVVRPGGL